MESKDEVLDILLCGCLYVRSTRVPIDRLRVGDASQQKGNPFPVAADLAVHGKVPLFYEIGTKYI